MTRYRHIIRVFAQICLGATFVYASGNKLYDGSASFLQDLRNFKFSFLQAPWTEIIAYGLPWLELIVGICLVADFCRGGSAYWSLLLSIVFFAAVGSAWWRGIDLRCGCFGISIEAVYYPRKILELTAMIVASLAVIRLGKDQSRFFQISVAKQSNRD